MSLLGDVKMIDLEQERKAFEAEWLNLGGHLNSFQIVNKMYVLTESVQSAGPVVKELSERAINSAFALWLIQARQKNTLIDQLTADLEKAQAVPEHIVTLQRNGEVFKFDLFDLLRRSLKSSKVLKTRENWSHVSKMVGIGSTTATLLCKEMNVDPDGKVFVASESGAEG